MACALLMAACGGSASATANTPSAAASAPRPSATAIVPTPSPTPDIHALGQQYLALATPVNSAVDTFNVKNNALGSHFSVAQIQAISTPLANAYQIFDNAVLRLAWPASLLADLHAMVAADSPEISDLQHAATTQAWFDQLARDATASSSAANVVRSDLGLPPPPPV
jgi:hypothetical protein